MVLRALEAFKDDQCSREELQAGNSKVGLLALLFRLPKNAAGFKCFSNKLPCHPRYGSVVFFGEVLDD